MRKFFKNALVLSLACAVAFGSFNPTSAKAATKTETLESSKLEAFADGTKADGDKFQQGIFTIYYSAKSKIDESKKEWTDGYTSAQRINFGGASTIEGISLKEGADAATVTKQIIEVAASGKTTVKVWWVSGGDDRPVSILDSEGEVLKKSETVAKNAVGYSEFELSNVEGGKIYVANVVNNNYIFKIEVTTETASAAADPTAAPTAAPTGSGSGSSIPATGDMVSLGLVAILAGACVLAAVATKKREEF